MKSLIIKYRISYLSSLFLSLLTFVFYSSLVFLFCYIAIGLLKIDKEWISENDFYAKLFLAAIGTFLAYLSYLIQKRRAKKESLTFDYYERIVVPVYKEIKQEKLMLEIGKYEKIVDLAIRKIPELDFEFYIPDYFAKELKRYNEELQVAIELKKEVNGYLYQRAFIKTERNNLGLNGVSGHDYFSNYLISHDKTFVYSESGKMLDEREQIEINRIALENINENEKFRDLIEKHNCLISIRNNINRYLEHFIRKAKKRLI